LARPAAGGIEGMIPAKRRNAVPFRVWTRAFIIAGLIFWAGFGLFVGIHKETQPPAQIRSNTHSGFPRTDAYILGSSLTERGFSTYGSLDSILFQDRLDVHYKMITRPYAVIGDFSPYLDEIMKAAPGVVLIESNIICADLYHRPSESLIGHLRQYRAFFRKIQKRLAELWLQSFSGLFRESPELRASGQGTAPDEKYWNAYKKGAKKFRVRRIDAFPEWNAFLGRARKAGIRVFLLELPRSREADRYVSKKFLEDQERLIRQFEERYHVIHLKFPRRLEQRAFFIDSAHFNRAGANLFSRWLVDRIWKCDGESVK
jgi:hypothetical protein